MLDVFVRDIAARRAHRSSADASPVFQKASVDTGGFLARVVRFKSALVDKINRIEIRNATQEIQFELRLQLR